ncbi:MAG TPA: hypothetical protein VG826_17715 [Pirellulales bacterium]|nr:hypothetical protein [Pirellulales bacterium]
MKRTIASTVPVFALLFGAGSASAQRPSEQVPLDAPKEQYLRAGQSAAYRLEKLLKPYQDVSQPPPQQLREKVRLLVEESFEARQGLQRADLEELRRRLADIERTIDSREKNKEAIINARVDEILSGKLPSPGTPDRADAERLKTRDGRLGSSAEGDSSMHGRQSEAPDFDLETRERLAQLDLQAAEEDYAAAEKGLAHEQKLHEAARVGWSAVEAREKDLRHASLELKRAKVKLDGLVKQRAEFEATADAAVNEATAQQREAMDRLRVSSGEMAAAKARLTAADADVAKASAAYEYREKQWERMKKLYEEKGVESKLLDEAEEQLAVARASLEGVQAAVAVAKAEVERIEVAIEQGRAEVAAAEERRQAAALKRARIGRPRQASAGQPGAPSE